MAAEDRGNSDQAVVLSSYAAAQQTTSVGGSLGAAVGPLRQGHLSPSAPCTAQQIPGGGVKDRSRKSHNKMHGEEPT